MQSNAKHKFECYRGWGARNPENNMGLMINRNMTQEGNEINMESEKEQWWFETHKKNHWVNTQERLL
jgi:dipeptidase